MKFGVCAILKNENLYLREWVEHYINLGFDKIILYDNNETNGEIPNIVIQDYIDAGYIDIYDKRGKVVDIHKTVECAIQTSSYNECLKKYKDELDWIIFLDIDEFLELEKHKKIQYAFNSNIYDKFDGILISSYMIGDDNQLYYENKPVQKRFKNHKIFEDKELRMSNLDDMIKCIVNTKSNKNFGYSSPHHILSNNLCNVNGEKVAVDLSNVSATGLINSANHTIMYFKHYYTKSLTEFLYKTYYYSWSDIAKNRKLTIYKTGNEWTKEHEKIYQKFLKQNNIKL